MFALSFFLSVIFGREFIDTISCSVGDDGNGGREAAEVEKTAVILVCCQPASVGQTSVSYGLTESQAVSKASEHVASGERTSAALTEVGKGIIEKTSLHAEDDQVRAVLVKEPYVKTGVA